MRLRRIVLVACMGFALVGAGGGVAGCGSGKVHFAKTKFALHAGLAFGAFHRYIYKPIKAGNFTPPLQHKAQIVKAGVAALFIYHELKVANKDAQSSPVLKKLLTPITLLTAKMKALATNLRHGNFSTANIDSAEGDLQGIASSSPQKIKEFATPVPGA